MEQYTIERALCTERKVRNPQIVCDKSGAVESSVASLGLRLSGSWFAWRAEEAGKREIDVKFVEAERWTE